MSDKVYASIWPFLEITSLNSSAFNVIQIFSHKLLICLSLSLKDPNTVWYFLKSFILQTISCNVDQKLPNCLWVCLQQCDEMKIKICTLHSLMDLVEQISKISLFSQNLKIKVKYFKRITRHVWGFHGGLKQEKFITWFKYHEGGET